MTDTPPQSDPARADADLQAALHDERKALLYEVEALTEQPLIALSFVWLILLIVDLTAGLSPPLEALVYVIWAIFILDFLLEIVIAPDNVDYLRRNWLTALALLLPALRVLRIFRAVRVLRLTRLLRSARGLRSVNLLRVVATLNRSVSAAGETVARRGIGYVAAITLIVVFGGAAGMYFFEGPPAAERLAPPALAPPGLAAGFEPGFQSYGEAVWWTAMLLTSIGSEYWPVTAEGRVLTLLLALYGLGMLGYIAGTVAGFFVEREG
ncbi:MAG: ion transporter [Candidatus Promineifilaceae bacterium]|nr:ion transporter [Candidatus Promineifilaceae bacterium]